MKNILRYKDFIGTVFFSAEDEVFYGKVEGLDDLVSFEGESVGELKHAFEEAVEEYIDLCKKENREVEKSYKGSFNVRLSPEAHKKASRLAILEGISLNQLIQNAIEKEIENAAVN